MSDAQPVHRLRELILSGELPAAAPLGEVSTAALLGVSRPMVREALRSLEAEGLVQSDGRRLRVTAISPSALADELRVRAALEGMCARLAAERVAAGEVAPASLHRLRELAEETEAVTAAGDEHRPEAVDLNRRFHLSVCELGDSPASLRVLRHTWNRILLATLQSLNPLGRPAQVAGEHRRIIEAIEDGDAAAAERAARDHVLGTSAAVAAQAASITSTVLPGADT
jgi:DNA-binding GntR family transcriptional regulator